MSSYKHQVKGSIPRCDVLASSRWEPAFMSALLPGDGAKMSHHLVEAPFGFTSRDDTKHYFLEHVYMMKMRQTRSCRLLSTAKYELSM